MSLDEDQQAVYLMLLGAKSTLTEEQQQKVNQFVSDIEAIALSGEGKLALAIVGAKLAKEQEGS